MRILRDLVIKTKNTHFDITVTPSVKCDEVGSQIKKLGKYPHYYYRGVIEEWMKVGSLKNRQNIWTKEFLSWISNVPALYDHIPITTDCPYSKTRIGKNHLQDVYNHKERDQTSI